MRIPDGSSRSPWWPTGNRGSALLYVIGALLALGAVGAGIAVMSPSSMQSKLEQEAGARAYYNAQSGRNFIYAIAKSSSYNNVKVNDFMTRMGNGNSVVYKISNNDQFNFTLSFSNATANSVDYVISSLIGEVQDSENNTQYSYLLYGGAKGGTVPQQYKSNSPLGGDILSSQFNAIEETGSTRTTEDASPNKNQGVLYGLTGRYHHQTTYAVSLKKGIIGNAFYFNPSLYGRVVYSSISAYNIYYSGSIALWFNADNFNNEVAGLLHKGESTVFCNSGSFDNFGMRIAIGSDEVYTLQFWPSKTQSGLPVYIIFSIIDGSQNTSCSGWGDTTSCLCRGSESWKVKTITSKKTFNNSDSGLWYFVVATWLYDNTTKTTYLKLYINGKEDKSESETPFTPRTNTSPIIVGSQVNSNRGNQDDYFSGYIDEVNVFDYPLTEAEVVKLYCEGMPSAEICQ